MKQKRKKSVPFLKVVGDQELDVKRVRPDYYARYKDKPDEYGFDLDQFAKFEPFIRFLYEGYFEVEVIGLENIPDEGRAVLVGNHSGGIPLDAFMFHQAMFQYHSSPRRVRALALDWLLELPVFGKLIAGMGGVPPQFNVAKELLQNEELVFFYPEGPTGTGKLCHDRYKLGRFDPGFVVAAMVTQSPIIPITLIGADEIFPMFGKSKVLAKILDMPYFPLTLTFPWLPLPAACIPLPIKFLIKIGKPIYLNHQPEDIVDKQLVCEIVHDIRKSIQREIDYLLSKRKGPFTGWDMDALRADSGE